MYKAVSFILLLVSCHLVTGQSSLYFPPVLSSEWDTVDPTELGWCTEELLALDDFAATSATRSLIILHRGKIAHEAYYNGHTADDSWYWASAGKSLTAFMIGMAQEQGLLDITDPTSDYLGTGWTSCSLDDEAKIRIIDQMRMVTGIDYEAYDGACRTPDCLTCRDSPGDEWYYQNGPYTLLSDVLEAATGSSYSLYTAQQLTARTGIRGLWVPLDDNVVFFSTARSMARYGLLVLAQGSWEGTSILSDRDYLQAMTSTSQTINPAYGYLWWLNGKSTFRLPSSTLDLNGYLAPDMPADAVMALGKNSQIIIVIPSLDMVIIRQGDDPDDSLVPLSYLRDLWQHIDALACVSSATTLATTPALSYIYPTVRAAAPADSATLHLYDTVGNLVVASTDRAINVQDLSTGIYIATLAYGGQVYSKLIYVP